MAFFSIASISDVSTFDVDTSGALQLNSSAGAISIGNDDIDQAINIGTQGERTISVGTGAFADTINIGNATGATAVAITSGTGSIALASTGTGDITINSDDTLLLDAVGVLELNSSAGAINIGSDDNDQAINIGAQGERSISIGTGAFADVIIIGNVTGATSIALNSGTGGIALASTGTGDITIDSDDTLLLDSDGILELNSSGGIISIGNDADAFNINVGTGGAARTITVGNVTGATGVVINSGTGGVSLASTGAGEITLDSSADINLDAGGADIVLKDDGTQFGGFSQDSGELVIKSSSSATTALTFSGANITTGGTLTLGSTSAITAGSYSGNAILVSDSGVVKHMTTTEFATEIGAITESNANTFTAKQVIDMAAANVTPATDGSHLHIEGSVAMTDNVTSGSGTAAAYSQVSIEAVTLAATNSSVTTTAASTLYINNAPTAGTNQTITNAYSLFVDGGACRFDGNIISSGFIINTYDTVTYGSNSGNITETSADGTTHDPTASSVFLQAVASSIDTTYHWDLSSFTGGGNGTTLHLVFDKEDDTGITALQVNFGSNKLYSGNGKNDSLTFSTSGQSASLIYMDSAWRIINTGAGVA
jgi:hypothetical protein